MPPNSFVLFYEKTQLASVTQASNHLPCFILIQSMAILATVVCHHVDVSSASVSCVHHSDILIYNFCQSWTHTCFFFIIA